MIKNLQKLTEVLIEVARQFAGGRNKVFVAVSGGVDSATVAGVLVKAFGPENVVGLYRNIRSNPVHQADVKALQAALGFKLIEIDGNEIYDNFIQQVKQQFLDLGLEWHDENSEGAEEQGFANAYACLKSRLTTPMSGFIAKAIDSGNGRIFGTGNGEEDGLLRYFDKFGDGAVDNNILNGLTKAEVRQAGRYLGVPERIITKLPSADLQANGDNHNDEDQLTSWAKKLGYKIKISYGASDGSAEGNVAWAWKEDLDKGVITGARSFFSKKQLLDELKYQEEEAELILFLRQIERQTRHKVEPLPGLDRKLLRSAGLVD